MVLSAGNREYFATADRASIGARCMEVVEGYYTDRLWDPNFVRQLKCFNYYYGLTDVGWTSGIGQAGQKGELWTLPVNDLRAVIQHSLVLSTSQRLNFEPKAVNSDAKSMEAARTAKGLLESYMTGKHMEKRLYDTAERSMVLGEGYTCLQWDTDLGEDVTMDPESGEVIREGDVTFESLTKLDVITDEYRADNDHDWMICRFFRNKFNLAAKYSDLAAEIVGQEIQDRLCIRFGYYSYMAQRRTSQIPVYVLFHKPTRALPEGRMVVFLAKDLVLFDGPIPYDEIPVYRCAPADIIGQSGGYTVVFDILAIQEAANAIYSTLLTNNLSFGVQNIAVPLGSSMSLEQLQNGMNLIYYSTQPPQGLNLTASSPESYQFAQILQQAIERLAGLSEVARGQVPFSGMSGEAIGLLQATAIQFNRTFERSYADHAERVATAAVKILRRNSTTKRVAMIVGESGESAMKEFGAEDLEQFDHVVVELSNPLARTVAGRLTMVEALAKAPDPETRRQMIEVVMSGTFEPSVEPDFDRSVLMKKQRELLAKGEMPVVTLLDHHAEMIGNALAVLYNPAAREPNPDLPPDGQVIHVVEAFIKEHEAAWAQMSDDELAITGQQALPSVQAQKQAEAAMAQAQLAANQNAGGQAPPPENMGAPEMLPTLDPSQQAFGQQPVPQELPIDQATGELAA